MTERDAGEMAPEGGRLEGRVHRLPIRIYYEDTDFSRIVYHANYLRYFERGRSECLRAIGISHSDLLAAQSPTAFAVLRMEIDFVSPARIDDALVIETAFQRIEGACLHVDQAAFCATRALARAHVVLCCIDDRGRPKKPPASLLQALKPFVGG